MARPFGSKNIKWNKDELKRLYWDNKMSCEQIAKQYGTVFQAVLKAMQRLGIPRRTCSEATSKELHYRWNGGRYSQEQGYIYVRADGHPRATSRNYVFEHILIAETKLGRYLKESEVVHHINGIKTDNRPENLMVFLNSEHKKVIPILQGKIRELEAENKRLSQSVMVL